MSTSGEGDRPDVGAVLARYGGWIRREARRHLGVEWEEGVQETLLRLSAALPRLADFREEVVRATVSRCLRSVFVDVHRRRARRPPATGAVDDLRSHDAGPPAASAARELALEVRGRFARLPERERRILKLRLVDGLAFRDIARLLGVPQGSVAGWYARAMAMIREGLEP